MELAQLPAEADGTFRAEYLHHVLQGIHQLVGRFVKNHGALFCPQGRKMLPAAFFAHGEEALKAKPAGGLPGNAQCGDGGTGTGNGADGDACGGTFLHQILTGVRDGGASCIGNQGAGLTGQNPLHNAASLEGFVMLVIAYKGLFDFQVVEQLQGYPGVLCGDEIRIFQGLPGTQGNVSQVSNGGGNQIKYSGHDVYSSVI